VPNGQNLVVLAVASKYMTIEIVVTDKGYTMNLLQPRKTFFKPIAQPLGLGAFIEYAKSLNLNVFTEEDASFYVTDAPLKLPVLEQHSYHCMSHFCNTHEFHSSVWNKVSNYRTICAATVPVVEKAMKQEIMVTVDRAEFVEIGKRVTDVESDVLELEFHRTPENQEVSRAPQMFMKNRNSHTASAVAMGVFHFHFC
jgi:Cancer susceptibility candidate 1 C-terminal